MITFENLPDTGLFLRQSDLQDPSQARIAFLYQDESMIDPFELSNATWQQGFYAFFEPSADRDWDAFEESLRAVFHTPAGIRFAWFSESHGSVKPVTSIITENSVITQSFQYNLQGNVVLNVEANRLRRLPISFNDKTGAFDLGDSTNPISALLISTNAAQQQQQFSVASPSLIIPVSGLNVATLCADFSFNARALEHFETGCMYFSDPDEAGHPLTALNYPVISPITDGESVSLTAVLDLLQPLSDSRTYFQINSPTLSSYLTTSLGRPFNFDTVQGTDGAIENCSRLVFARRPVQDTAQSEFYYLTLAGSFRLVQKEVTSADHKELLCGVIGTEFLAGITTLPQEDAHSLENEPGVVEEQPTADTITFFPDHHAFRPTQPVNKVAVNTPVYLTDAVTTAWIQFSTSTGHYISQPPKSPLYQQSEQMISPANSDQVASLLDFYPLPAWSASQTAITPVVPMAPYSGIRQSASDQNYLDAYHKMEAEALNPTRKDIFLFHPDNDALEEPIGMPAANDEDTSIAMTPQGVLAVLSPASVWTGMQIAKSPSGILQFTQMQKEIRQVMQQNQIFSVITNTENPDNQNQPYFAFDGHDQTVEIADWFFSLSPELTKDSDGNPPILMLKFFPGKSIAELIDDTDFWSQPTIFNTDYTAQQAQQFIKAAIQSACKAVYGDQGMCVDGAPSVATSKPDTASIYYNFLKTVTDPNFSGALALNCNLQLNNLPTAIKAVMGGMNKPDGTSNITAFRAHHVGVTINDTNPNGDQPALVQSSFFALVDYEKPTSTEGNTPNDLVRTGSGTDITPANASVDVNYGFEVEYLRALFTNSELRDFSCKLNLTINNLFNINVNLGDLTGPASDQSEKADAPNIIPITGSYQAPEGSDGNGMYSFIAEGSFDFAFTSNPYLKSISLNKLEYTFQSETPTGTDNQTKIASRFALWGNMVFKDLDVLDLFSFEKLVFGDLGIAVDFDLTLPEPPTPPSTSDLSLAFHPGNLRLDLGQTKNKSGDTSLLSLLPFKLKSFLYSENQTTTLESLDYILLDSVPGLNGISDTFDFALTFDLDLGSLGALVGSLEAFKFSAIIGWHSETDAQSGGIAFGIKLPEADGKLEINIEGVLKLVIGKFILKYVSDEKNPGGSDLLVVGLWESYLELFGVRMPPNQKNEKGEEVKGVIDFALFAPADNPEKLGWIAAVDYTSKEKDKGKESSVIEHDQHSTQTPAPAQRKNTANSQSGNSSTGDDKKGGPVFELVYLGGGQRVGPSKDDTPKDFAGFLSFMQDDFIKAVADGNYGKVYHPDGKWLLVANFKLIKIIEVGFVFYDTTPFYSLMLNVKDLFNFEITYTKISDTIGLFYANFSLPDSLRTFQVGAASLTLPSIGVSVYTNGNWKLDVGFPKGDDWSRCFRVEAMAGPIPVTGSGGFYLASLSSATTDVFKKEPFDKSINYPSIISFGFALRVGIGKDFTSGPLKAGISVTFFGIIEGSAGYLESGTKEIFKRPDALALNGQVGLIGEIYGSIDFVIISASLNVTLQASIGMQIAVQFTEQGDTNGNILLYVEASVRVSLRVSINLGLFSIHVSVSFHASFRFQWELLSSSHQTALPAAAAQFDITPANVPLFPGLSTKPLPVWFTPELTVVFSDTSSNGIPWMTTSLLVQYDENPAAEPVAADLKPFESLAVQLSGWALISASDGLLNDWSSEVSLEFLTHIDKTPEQLTRWITYDILLTQLEQFSLEISIPEATSNTPEDAHASVFPMFPFLKLSTSGRKKGAGAAEGDLSYQFSDKNHVSDTYIASLNAYFDQMFVNQNPGSGAVNNTDDGTGTALIEGVFLDYFTGMIRTTVHALLHTLENTSDKNPISLEKLMLKAIGTKQFLPLAGQMSNSFRGGARLPYTNGQTVPDGQPNQETNALYALLWQTFPVGDMDKQYTLSMTNPDTEKSWVKADVNYQVTQSWVQPFSTVTADAIVQPASPEQIAYTRTGPQAFTFANPTAWTGPLGDQDIRPFPANLEALLSPGSAPIHTTVESRATGAAYLPGGTPLTGDAYTWATRIDLSVTEVPGSGAAPLANTFALRGASQEAQALLEQILDFVPLTGTNSTMSLQFLYQKAADAEGLQSDTIEPENVFVLRTNTTTVTVPPPGNDIQFAALDEEKPDVAVGARIDETYKFLQIIQQASVTNAPGYYLYYENKSGNTLPPELFSNGPAPVTLLITHTADSTAPVQPYYNSIVLKAPTDALTYYAETTDDALAIQYPSTAAGSIGVMLTRNDAKSTNGKAADNSALEQLDSLYSLFTYQIEADKGYIASNLSAPVQPQQSTDSDESSQEHDYRIFAPLYKVADANQPPGAQSVTPAVSHANRYASLNEPFTIAFQQTDSFGNQLPGAREFSANNLYFDPIIPVDQWQGIITQYDFLVNGSAKSKSLTLYLTPSETAFDDLLSAEALLTHYLNIYDQITGPGVSFYVETNLALENGMMQRITLSDTQTAQLKTLVEQVITYLKNPSGQFSVEAQSLVITVSDTEPVPSVFEIAVTIGITRDKKYLSPTLIDANGHVTFLSAQDVSSAIVAKIIPGDSGTPGIDTFAAQFSDAFTGQSLAVGLNGASSSLTKSVTSLARASLKADNRAGDGSGDAQTGPQSLWAVSRSVTDITIGTETDHGPFYASPKPLNNQLQSGTVPLNGLIESPLPSPGDSKAFTAVDLDQYNRQFFEAVDTVLSPASATFAFKRSPTAYQSIAQGRRKIADQYAANEINWLFDNSSPYYPGDSNAAHYLKEAQETFGQQMRSALLTAYSVDTIVQFGVGWQSSLADDTHNMYALFGQIQPVESGSANAPEQRKNTGLSTAKVDVVNQGTGLLTFLYGTPEIQDENEVTLDLEFDITHLEIYLAPPKPMDDGEARPSMWLQLINAYDKAPHVGPANQETTIPLILRDYPTLPTAVSQTGVAEYDSEDIQPDELNKAAQWRYDFIYQAQMTAHDQIAGRVTFNTPQISNSLRPTDITANANNGVVGPFSLFESLARFTTAAPIIGPALANQTEPTHWDAAIMSLAGIVDQVVQNTTWNPLDITMAGNSLEKITDHYTIFDQPQMSNEVKSQSIDSSSGVTVDNDRLITVNWPAAQGESTFADKLTIQALDTSLTPYPGQQSGQIDNGITTTYSPVPPLENDFVTHRLEFEGLNVLAAENTVAGVQIKRNVMSLNDSPVKEEFTYTTGLVSFTSPVTPFIVSHAALNITELPNQQGQTLSQLIATLLTDLLDNQAHAPALLSAMARTGQSDDAQRRIKVECNYDYPIASADGSIPAKPLRVAMPVVLARSFDIDPQSTQISDFAAQYADAITVWSRDRNITYGSGSDEPESSRFVFDITLYALLSQSNIPLLELTNLQLNLADIAED